MFFALVPTWIEFTNNVQAQPTLNLCRPRINKDIANQLLLRHCKCNMTVHLMLSVKEEFPPWMLQYTLTVGNYLEKMICLLLS